jgi:hypothetical protein
MLVAPVSAEAATAPTLDAPAWGASSFVEGGSMTFSWNGALQGDPDAISRSFFRVEVMKASDVPTGAQTAWTDVENFLPTEPGQSVTEAELGVPDAGSYKWRVCAWGVVDDLAKNEIEQLPGGCSGARSFETKAATIQTTTIGEMKMETKTQVEGQTNTVYVTRPAEPETETEPAKETPATPVEKPKGPSLFQPLHNVINKTGKTTPAVSLGEDSGLAADPAAKREKGVSGAIMSGLGSSLPLVPIPFWTLALLLACVPLARMWRTSVLGMFDWADGSIDGSGGLDHVIDDIAVGPHDQLVKIRSNTADGDAPAPTRPTSAPERGRRAA